MTGVSRLENDSNRKALIESHPVKGLLDIRQTGDACVIRLEDSPSDSLDLALEVLAGVTEQRDVGVHSRPDSIEQILPEIREHVPVAVVDEYKYRLPDVGVLPFGDVQVGHVAIERRLHEAVVVVELRLLDRFLRRADSLIDVARTSQCILCLL